MEKRICAKFSQLPNVVGRVDYISNPKRQENLLGFYQTPENPEAFWCALSEESQQFATYNKAQMEEHNRIEEERFAAGEIKKKNLWKTVEAREMMLCLPNSIDGRVRYEILAKAIAEDIKARHGIECAVGIHLNKKKTNLHAHIILPERTLLPDQSISIATRNTYFDADGKRSSKKECTDENGKLKPGCRLVRKGDALSCRRFSEKDPRFASKGFCYGEKKYFAELFNKWTKDKWVVYNHYQNPHIRLHNLKRGEPDALRAWKERENRNIRAYNSKLDELLQNGEISVAQALEMKQQFYIQRAEEREQRKRDRDRWFREWSENQKHRNRLQEQKNTTLYTKYGRKRTTLELLIILGMTWAGALQDKKEREVEQLTGNNVVHVDWKVQQMIDDVYIKTHGQVPPWSRYNAEKMAEDVKKEEQDDSGSSPAKKEPLALQDIIDQSEAKRDENMQQQNQSDHQIDVVDR